MCRMNAVRSPMAETLARSLLPAGTYVASAGIRPGERDPFVDAVLSEVGLSLGRHAPHSLDELEDDYFDLIVTLSPEWENAFAESLIGNGEDKQLAMAPSRLQDFIRAVRDTFERIAMTGENPVLLTGPMTRPYVRSIIERFRGQTVVMSQNEIHPKARLRTLGQV